MKVNRYNIADHLVEYQLNMVGKTIEEATQYAKDGGFIVRITEENGQAKMLEMDANPNRINFRVKHGYVIDAYGG